MRFQIRPIAPSLLAGIRSAGRDKFGNPFEPFVNEDPDGAPLRCCLREARVGERIALIAHRPFATGGPYAEVGPVFVHAEACEGYEAVADYPVAFAHRRQVQRGYDRNGNMIETRIAEPGEAPENLAALLAQPGVAFVHSRNVAAGCFMFEAR